MKFKKAQIGLTIIFALMIFVCGMLVLTFLRNDIAQARTDLNCEGSGLTDGTKLTCLLFSLTTGYWILLILSASVGSILARVRI